MKKLIVGNWKMHGFVTMAHPLVAVILHHAQLHADTAEVVLCPPATLISRVAQWANGSPVKVGGQDCRSETHGAYTGDISAAMLDDDDCSYVIVGHSERRQYHHESDPDIRGKASAAITAGLIPIICVGETMAQREKGDALQAVDEQVRNCLPPETVIGNFVLAYEPVWAIGSGQVPAVDDISQMHAHIAAATASLLAQGHDNVNAPVHVIYGGSVKPGNARAILNAPGVTGVLVGGASLKDDEFCSIIAATA